MAVNQREKVYIGIIGAIVVLAGGYAAIAKPYWLDQRVKLKNEITKAEKQQKADAELLKSQDKMKESWETLRARGLVDDEFTSAANLEDTITELGRRNRVTIESQKVTRTPAIPKTDFKEVRIAVSGAGSSMGIWPFLYALEDSRLPIKIDDVQIRSRKDGVDDLMIELNVSTLVFKPVVDPKAAVASTKPSTRAATMARAAATRPTTQPEATSGGPTLDQLEAQLRARRQLDANGGTPAQPPLVTQAPSTQPSTQPSPSGGVR